jgi:transcriptional regulatory protein LevR
VAIVGTMEIHYQKIPFIPAMNLFKREKILEFQDLLGSTITLPEMVDSLTKNFSPELDVKTLFLLIDDVLQLIRKDQELIIENTALQALSVHIAFLVDKIKKGENRPTFENVKYFHQQHRVRFNQTAANLSVLEKQFGVRFTEDDIAYIVKTLEDNRIELGLHSV